MNKYITSKQTRTLDPSKQGYRSDNARKSNSSRFPNGYLYIIKLEGHPIYKVGVSQNPKRRLKDISSNNPFEIAVLFLKAFENVYQLEKLLIDLYEINKIKGEWFNAYEDCIQETVDELNQIHFKAYGQTKQLRV